MESYAARARSKSITIGQQHIVSLAEMLLELAPTLLKAALEASAMIAVNQPSEAQSSLLSVVASLELRQCQEIALRIAQVIATSSVASSIAASAGLSSSGSKSSDQRPSVHVVAPSSEYLRPGSGNKSNFDPHDSRDHEPSESSFISFTSPPNPIIPAVPFPASAGGEGGLFVSPRSGVLQASQPSTGRAGHGALVVGIGFAPLGASAGSFPTTGWVKNPSSSMTSSTHIIRKASLVTGLLHQMIQTSTTKLVEDENDDIVQINDYHIIDEAGRGMFGVVKIAVRDIPDENVYAIKIVPKRKMKKRPPMHRSDASTTSSSKICDSGVSSPQQHVPAPPAGSSNSQSSPPRASLLRDPAATSHHESKSKTEVSPPRQHLQAETATDRPTAELVDEVRREIEVMKTLRHRNIVNLLEVIDDPEDPNLYLVMPYCDRGPIVTLSKEGKCEPLDVDVARGYMRQITAGLAYLHTRHVAHMDIKPDNILLNASQRCCLSDFGTSEFFDDGNSMQRGLRGTPAFASPEAIASDVFNPFQADIWSLGVTFYVMLFGEQPFKGCTLAELMKSITQDEVSYDAFPDDDYEDAIDLLALMLNRNAVSRPSAMAIRNHPFLAPRGGRQGAAPRGGIVNRVQHDVLVSRNGEAAPVSDSNESTLKPSSS